jgi:UDP-N-acetylmuramoyl-tripeptide--D-alanyl-D-alanine ligase
VFQVRAEHEAGIFELGMNRRGEIAEIGAVLRPVIALVTNVSTAHIGIIGTKAGIAEEKKAIFSFFTGTETALIPAESAFVAYLSEGVKGDVRPYPGPDGVFDNVKDRGIFGWECTVKAVDGTEGIRTSFALPGRHNLWNAAAAVAIARAVGIGTKVTALGLSSVRPLPGRGEVVETVLGGHRVTVVNDAYNANPDSMEKALSFFDETAWNGTNGDGGNNRRKIVVAGEMFELGEHGEAEHKKLFLRLDAVRADKKYFFHVSDTIFPGGNIAVYNDMERLKATLTEDAREGDLVLLKGSRLCALERILQE